MNRIINLGLARIFLVVSCLLLISGELSAQRVPVASVKKRPYISAERRAEAAASPVRTGHGDEEIIIDTVPWYASGKTGFYFTPSGTITGDVLVVGLKEGKFTTLEPKQQQTVKQFFESGMESWKKSSANVCGTSARISPQLTLRFVNSESEMASSSGKSILYITSGMGNVAPRRDEGRVAVGWTVPYWKQMESLRGTGTLPPITFYMADPEVAKTTEYVKGIKGDLSWIDTITHELGHAMGLVDTYLTPAGLLTKESPPGHMNAVKYKSYEVKPAYIVEIMTRVFECRLDITTTVRKTTGDPVKVDREKWDYTGTAVSRYTDVLTSEWAYFNGTANTWNFCTVPDTSRATYFTYQACNGDPKLNNANQIDFNLGEAKINGDFLWEWQTAFPPSFTADFSVSAGNCTSPVRLLEDYEGAPLPYILPDFYLATDGNQTWMQDANIVPVLGSAEAKDPIVSEPPSCDSGVSWTGEKIKKSQPVTTSPLTTSGDIYQHNSLNNPVIGTYTIEVKFKLSAKTK